MMTDPISDMLTRIRNGHAAKKRTVVVPFSKVKKAIAEILLSQGYLAGYSVEERAPKMMVLELKYHGKRSAITAIRRESTPGHRVYRKAEELPKVLNDYGLAIVSTSRGIMTNKEARTLGIGGEVICSVY